MFTILADSLLAATRTQRNAALPLHLRNHGETYIPRSQRHKMAPRPVADPHRYLW